MKKTKQVSFRCPEDRYMASKEKANKLNLDYSEYMNILVENDLRENGVILNQKWLIQGMCRISTSVNHLVEHYPNDEDVRNLKEETKAVWQIL